MNINCYFWVLGAGVLYLDWNARTLEDYSQPPHFFGAEWWFWLAMAWTLWFLLGFLFILCQGIGYSFILKDLLCFFVISSSLKRMCDPPFCSFFLSNNLSLSYRYNLKAKRKKKCLNTLRLLLASSGVVPPFVFPMLSPTDTETMLNEEKTLVDLWGSLYAS